MPGDSYSSRRLFSLIFAGTIPVGVASAWADLLRSNAEGLSNRLLHLPAHQVIICDSCQLPYQDMLNYGKFAIFLPELTILDAKGEIDIFQILEKVSPEEIASLQKYGRLVKRHFTYHEGKPQPGDAFDLLVGCGLLILQLIVQLTLPVTRVRLLPFTLRARYARWR